MTRRPSRSTYPEPAPFAGTDMVVANGNDMSPQPLTVYYNRYGDGSNQPAPFEPWPDWYSEDIGYMMELAAGDIDNDGDVDLVVALAFDMARNPAKGGAS